MVAGWVVVVVVVDTGGWVVVDAGGADVGVGVGSSSPGVGIVVDVVGTAATGCGPGATAFGAGSLAAGAVVDSDGGSVVPGPAADASAVSAARRCACNVPCRVSSS